ncbi:MAG: sensor domain-containing diguanylate cyclase [bacterium]
MENSNSRNYPPPPDPDRQSVGEKLTSALMNKLNNNKTVKIAGTAAIILWIIAAAVTFDRTFIPLKKCIGRNSSVILHISVINEDIEKIGFLMKKVVFYETYKPVNYKNDIKRNLKSLSLIINKTDGDYKSLFTLLHIKPPARSTMRLNKASFSNFEYFSTFVKKSYYQWEYVSKPIIERFIKYSSLVSLKLSNRMFIEYSLDKSILPTSSFIRKISAGFARLIRFAAFAFIFGTMVIVFLGILVVYYLNKFFREIRKNENTLKKSLEFFKILSENIPSMIGLYREKIIYINPFGLKMLGYSEETVKGLNPLDLIEAREEEKIRLWKSIKKRLNGELFEEKYILRVKKKNGETFWGELLTTTILYENKWTGLVIISDVNEKVVKEQKLLKEKDVLKELAEIDALTEVYNRRSLDEKLSDCLNDAFIKNIKFSLIMLDIDHFKEINDTFGHQAGDTVLSELAFLVKENIRKEDFLARFGGEEFMIISNGAGIKNALELAEKLRSKIELHNFSIKSGVNCSFGVTAYKYGDTDEAIIKRVDDALYKAKENGRNRVESI